eukprot:gene9541-1746_t
MSEHKRESHVKGYTASDLFVECLINEGVKYVFGVPGEENADFMISLEKTDKIKFILTRHEQGAAFMCDAFGRLTGEASVCLGTLGPGATNLTTGVADANMDRAPIVVITGQGATTRIHKESHQIMDVVAMFKPITKWNQPIRTFKNIPEVVRKAFKVATQEKPGATHIELSEDIAGELIENYKGKLVPLQNEKIRRPVPDDKIMGKFFDVLKKAKQPVILAGNGCVRKRASKQLRAFCKSSGIGCINTFMAKGCLDMDDPQCLFTIGLSAKDYTAHYLDECDLIICIGYDLVEYHPHLWNGKKERRIVHIDFDEAEIDEFYSTKIEIVGDLGHTLWMMNEWQAKEKIKFELPSIKKIRESLIKDFNEYKDDDTKGTIKPQKVLYDVRKLLGPSDILLSDVGAHKMWIARYYQCHDPNTCLISNGFCSMGFALPGAIGAKIAFPDRKVVAICGDGGFLMNVQEMETASRVGANIVVIVWVDGGYGLIEWKQDTEFGKHTNLAFNNPDFIKLAEAFGWVGYHVENSKDFEPTLEKALNQTKPVLLSLPIDYRENPLLTKKLGEISCQI